MFDKFLLERVVMSLAQDEMQSWPDVCRAEAPATALIKGRALLLRLWLSWRSRMMSFGSLSKETHHGRRRPYSALHSVLLLVQKRGRV